MTDELQAKRIPLAYLLTFRTYGTWLHGDERSSVDRRDHNKFGQPRIPQNDGLMKKEMSQMTHEPFRLNAQQREIVYRTIREVCIFREYTLHMLNVRSNHIHVVVSASVAPEKVMEAFKSYTTRKLRAENLVDAVSKIWSRHGSTRYLWNAASLQRAISYVEIDQDDDLPRSF